MRSWPNGARSAARLVQVGLWEHTDGGYFYAWIRKQNTPDAIRANRAKELRKWERKQTRNRAEETPEARRHLRGIAGWDFEPTTPPGRYRGESAYQASVLVEFPHSSDQRFITPLPGEIRVRHPTARARQVNRSSSNEQTHASMSVGIARTSKTYVSHPPPTQGPIEKPQAVPHRLKEPLIT